MNETGVLKAELEAVQEAHAKVWHSTDSTPEQKQHTVEALWVVYRDIARLVHNWIKDEVSPHGTKTIAEELVKRNFSTEHAAWYSIANEVFVLRVEAQHKVGPENIGDLLDEVIDILGREEVIYVLRGQHGVDATGDDGSDEPNQNDEVRVTQLIHAIKTAKDFFA